MASTTSYTALDKLQIKLMDYTREIAYGVLALLVIGASIYAYIHYNTQLRETAQVALAETLDDLRKAQEGGIKWSDVELAALAGAKNNPSTGLSPYFGIVKAQALIRQEKLVQALEVLEENVKQLNSSNPVRDLYEILKARLIVRLNGEKQDQAVVQLNSIARSNTSAFQDMALYYLYQYYALHEEPEKAASVFNELKTRFVNPEAPSPWMYLAEQA